MDTAEPVSSAETPDMHGAYPRLSEPQIQALAAYGMRRRTRLGDVLFREGDPTCDFFVFLEEKVAIVEGYGTEGERVLSVHGPGRFLGELSLLTGEVVFVTAVVREPGEVLAVPLQQLRLLVGKDPVLGDLILRAYLIRRSILIEHGAGFRSWARGSHRTRGGCASSPLATGCPIAGSTWRRTRRRRCCCAGWVSNPTRRRWCSGGRRCCATRATRSWLACSACAGRARVSGSATWWSSELARRAGRRRLRRLRGSVDNGAGCRGRRRPGGDLLPHRELPHDLTAVAARRRSAHALRVNA
jgi:hypothetical protein